MKKHRYCPKCGKRRKMSHEISASLGNEFKCEPELVTMKSWHNIIFNKAQKLWKQMSNKEAK